MTSFYRTIEHTWRSIYCGQLLTDRQTNDIEAARAQSNDLPFPSQADRSNDHDIFDAGTCPIPLVAELISIAVAMSDVVD
mmetsp:Transcript_25906/g.49111  ORF Transcript_25906/g.49111 Transcript_25906/m.49111 type:complete len:80 (+) Transcript_25906:81-320(+)